MKKRLLEIIRCPRCQEKLNGSSNSVTCKNCQTSYSVVDGLPVILSQAFLGEISQGKRDFGLQWEWQNVGKFERDTIYGKTQNEELNDFLKIFNIKSPEELTGKKILDAGCGSGRLTKALGQYATEAIVVGIDLSSSAKIAFDKCKNLENTYIIQCDLLNTPFKNNFFDYVWSEGVIHHTQSSKDSFIKLSSLVSKSGKLYVWVYPKYILTPYGLARALMIFSYLLHPKYLYALSFAYAIPTRIIFWILNKSGIYKNNYKMKTFIFKYFDSLSPRFQHYHSKKEVNSWFVEENFRDIQVVGNLGVVGSR